MVAALKVELKHGAGGGAMDSILKASVIGNFQQFDAEVPLSAMDDSAVVNGIAFSTDSYTVRPIFFPGGDIGRLAVSGTINDVSMIGAKPIALSSGIVLEEGFETSDLERITKSMGETAARAGVGIVTGDLKVVEKGSLDRILINTSGIGVADPALDSNHLIAGTNGRRSRWLTDSNLADGDVIIASGYIGDHGVAIMSSREGYGFESNVKSDVAPLNGMIHAVLEAGGVVAAKDPTRGGVANALNEWNEKSGTGIEVEEENIPIREGVRSACELLGIDPLHIGNEGKALIAVIPERAEAVLEALHRTEEGKNASIIGVARKELKYVVLRTEVGGERILERPVGDPVPRIC